MTTLAKAFHGNRSPFTDENIEGTFYENITLDTCGLRMEDGAVVWDHSVENNYYAIDADNYKKYLESRHSAPQHITPDQVETYIPLANVQVLFIETETEVLYNTRNILFEEDWNDRIMELKVTASTGYVLYVDSTWDEMSFLEVPMKYQCINRYYYNDTPDELFLDRAGYSHTMCVPYFKVFPIDEHEDVGGLLKCVNQLFPSLVHTSKSYKTLTDVPAPLRSYFLRKNKKEWTAANRIAKAWSQAYWSPYTEVGRRRLARRFLE